MLLELLLLTTPATPSTAASGLLGNWVTPNKSILQVYQCDNDICIKIAHVDEAVGHRTDGLNPDAGKRARPLCGLTIGTGFAQKDDDHAEGGKLYDPESGRMYSGTITLVNGSTLRLHGYIGFSVFGRTEEWHRASDEPANCKA